MAHQFLIFGTGAIIGTKHWVLLVEKEFEFAIGISVPVGLLLVQLDIFSSFCGVYFLHRVDRTYRRRKFS